MNNGRRRPDFRRGRQDPADPNKKPMPKWVVWLAVGLLALALVGPQIWPAEDATKITYTEFLSQVRSDKVREITINNTSNKISGEFKDGTKFSTTGNVDGLSDADEDLLKQRGVAPCNRLSSARLRGTGKDFHTCPPLPACWCGWE